MAFPTVESTTTHLDSDSDSPASARAEIKDAVDNVNAMISSRNTANGALVINSQGRIDSVFMPDLYQTVNNMVLASGTGIIEIQNYLRMTPYTVAEANALGDVQAGDVAYISDGDGGSPCLAVHNGTNWLRVALGSAIST